jgi:hypothetical protein
VWTVCVPFYLCKIWSWFSCAIDFAACSWSVRCAPNSLFASGSHFRPGRFLFADPVREGSVLGQLQCFFKLQVHASGLRSGLLFFDCIARTGFRAKVSRSSTAPCWIISRCLFTTCSFFILRSASRSSFLCSVLSQSAVLRSYRFSFLLPTAVPVFRFEASLCFARVFLSVSARPVLILPSILRYPSCLSLGAFLARGCCFGWFPLTGSLSRRRVLLKIIAFLIVWDSSKSVVFLSHQIKDLVFLVLITRL